MTNILQNESDNNIEEKLDFIGLNLKKIPNGLMNFVHLDFEPSNTYNDNEHKIFQYVSIDKLNILLTPTNRLNSIKEKYSKAQPLAIFLNEKNEKEYGTFLNMLNTISFEEVEKIADKQNKFNKEIPFSVRYNNDFEWQIYYSEPTNQYFMLVTMDDKNYNHLFYLLREKIKILKSKTPIDKFIYVPINHINYSNKFLKKDEISDLEKYIWLFTKDWPHIFEVTNKENVITLQIVGNANVYKTIKSSFKFILKDENEAKNLYKYLKAFFILQTELPFRYNFNVKILKNNEFLLCFEDKEISINFLTEFVQSEYNRILSDIANDKKDIFKFENNLLKLKQDVALKELEYTTKQKEISMYLECKKTFLGKIKLYLKSNKKNKNDMIEKKICDGKIEEDKFDKISEAMIETRTYYTIEDLVVLCSVADKVSSKLKAIKNDSRSLEIRIENLCSKIKNATLYIDEINKHKKNIFDFWRFVNKDNIVALEQGNENNLSDNNHIKKVFDYKTDLSDFGEYIDKKQRKHLLKEVHDALFLLQNKDILEYFNLVKSNKNIPDDYIEKLLNKFKEDEEKRSNNELNDFDIFGSIADNTRNIKTLANQRHRESEKNIFKILNINKNTSINEFKERLDKVYSTILDSYNKINLPFDVALYNSSTLKNIDENTFGIFNLIPEKVLTNASNSVNIWKINFPMNANVLFYTNIIFFDNFNQTLPIGMDVEHTAFIDLSRFTFEKIENLTFNIADVFTKDEIILCPKVKKINVIEFNAVIKECNNDK